MGGKKKLGMHPKRIEAKKRKEEQKREAQNQKRRREEDEYWKETDKKALQKLKRKEQKKEGEFKERKKKQEMKKILQQEEEENLKLKKGKKTMKEHLEERERFKRKHDQYLSDLQQNNKTDHRVKKLEHYQGIQEFEEEVDDIDEILNEEFKSFYKMQGKDKKTGMHIANNVDQALDLVQTGGDKHPEKRVKKVWRSYVDTRYKEVNAMFPKMKRSTILNMLWKEFQSSELNPMNRKDNFVWKKH